MNRPASKSAARIFWIGSSLVAGLIMVYFGIDKGLFRNPETRVFEVSVFFGAWVAIALLLRVFARRFQRLEDLTLERLVEGKDKDPTGR